MEEGKPKAKNQKRKHQATTFIQQMFIGHLCTRHYSRHLGYTNKQDFCRRGAYILERRESQQTINVINK